MALVRTSERKGAEKRKSHLPNQVNWSTTARPLIRGMLTSGMEDGDAQSPNNSWYIRDCGPAERYYRADLNSANLSAHHQQLRL